MVLFRLFAAVIAEAALSLAYRKFFEGVRTIKVQGTIRQAIKSPEYRLFHNSKS